MAAAGTVTVRWRGERARLGPWRGEPGTARLSPAGDGSLPSAALVARCLERLRAEGYDRAVTGALSPAEAGPFVDAGFAVRDRLHVLRHDLRSLPPHRSSVVTLGRGGRRWRAASLAVDAEAFGPGWRLDDAGLVEALAATSRSRHRVALDQEGGVVGYAVTGLSARRGYLQRVAVAPRAQRRGVGWALVADSLRWLRRHRARWAVVNTEVGNEAALALYEAAGFVRQPAGLVVLGRELSAAPRGAP